MAAAWLYSMAIPWLILAVVLTQATTKATLILNVAISTAMLAEGSAVNISVTYSGGTPIDLQGSINGTNVMGSLSPTTNTGSLVVTSDDVSEFGLHEFEITLSKANESTSLSIWILYYEEPITGLAILYDKQHVAIGKPVAFNISLITGTSVSMQWYLAGNGDTITTRTYEGPLREDSLAYTFLVATSNIVVNASNSISSVSLQLPITSQYTVTGFTVPTNFTSFFGPLEQINLTLVLDSSVKLPMGNVQLDVDFGDENSTHHDLKAFINDTQQHGLTISHSYAECGNFSAKFRIHSEVNAIELTVSINVWTNINTVMSTDIVVAKTDQLVTFSFDPIPKPNFEYTVDYGNGHSELNSTDVLLETTGKTTWTYAFPEPGEFVVKTTAWYPFHFIFWRFTIVVQRPIPASKITISPASEEIPLPDGTETCKLTLDTNVPPPTSVSCIFDFGEAGFGANESTTIAYGSPVVRSYVYLTPGQKTVTFTCYNLVSTMTKKAQISVRSFTLADFTLSFYDAVQMNMTFEEVEERVLTDPSIVDFSISLFNCVRLPPDIEISWDFADGKVTSFEHVTFYKSHAYTERGIFNVTVHLKSPNETFTLVPKELQTGIGRLSVDKYSGHIGVSDTIIFTITGPNFPCNYFMSWDMHGETMSNHSVVMNNRKFNFVYDQKGEYMPYLIVSNSIRNIYERIYLSQYIKMDYSLENLTITLSNTTIMNPPGDIVVSVAILGPPTPMTKCTVQMDDFIDVDERIITHNITIEDPIILEFNYLTFGTHHVNITCQNLVYTVILRKNVSVINPCFTYGGIFAWQYSKPTRPLLISTAVQTDLSNRMSVKCYDRNPKFAWAIYRFKDGPGSNLTLVHKTLASSKGTYRFEKASKTPGLYKVTLNVTLDGTWAMENSYVRFTKPIPFVWIRDGSERLASPGSITVDAVSESYSAELGFGHTEVLNFTFFCYRYINSSFSDLRKQYQTLGGPNAFKNGDPPLGGNETEKCHEDLSLVSTGVVTIDTTNYVDYTFLIVLRVEEDFTFPAIFTQMIKVEIEDRPSATIRCEVNCRKKLAVQNTLKVTVDCEQCGDTDITYDWKVYRFLQQDSTVEMPISQDQSHTGTQQRSFSLAANVFMEDTGYKLNVSVMLPGHPLPATAVMTFHTNMKPYGGLCQANPTSGVGMMSTFSVKCFDWKDEGPRDVRNATMDVDAPLKYEYVQEIPRMVGGHHKTIQSPLFRGNEDSATELRLQIGDPDFDYTVTILVKVQDFYGDVYECRDAVVTVERNESLIPVDENDMSSLENLYQGFRENFLPLQAGGNKVAVAQFVGSAGVLLASINVSAIGNTTIITNQNAILMEALLGTTTLGVNEALNSADSHNVLENVKACLGNLDIVTDSILDMALQTAGLLSGNLADILTTKPFPVEDLENVHFGTSGTCDIVDTALAGLIPETMIDPDEVITIEDIRAKYNMDNPPINGSISAEEELEQEHIIQDIYTNAIIYQESFKERSEQAKGTIPKLLTALENAQNTMGRMVMLGEPEVVIEKDNVVLTVVKMTPQTLLNGTNSSKISSIELEFNSLHEDLGSSELQIQTAVFNKIPQYHGKGASKLSSKAILISLKKSDGTSTNASMDMKISNEMVATAQKYQPIYLPGDTDKMLYIFFNLPSKDDAVIFYIKPDDFNPFDFSSYGLYDVYVRSGDYPSTSVHDWTHSMTIRDWESSDYGFKIFIPQNSFSAGKVYLALKPLPATPTPVISNRMKREATLNMPSDDGETTENTTPTEVSQTTNNTGATSGDVTRMTTTFEPADVNFTVVILTSGCRNWDEPTQTWTARGCTVLPFSTLNETICRCPEATGNMFATTFFVAPNTIDFNTVWSKFDAKNASVYATLISLMVMYILLCIWARRMDKKDIEKWTTHFLCDTDRNDEYFYLLTVHTGLRPGSGTKSSVQFVLSGERMDSGVRILSDGISEGFERGSIRRFIMGTNEALGDLSYLRVWHDNSGSDGSQSWYLDKIVTDDLQDGTKYVFLCGKWLSVDHEDGSLHRIVPVSQKDALTKFNTLFSEHAKAGLTENHLWVSAFMRPEKSRFTRVQRLSCILMLLLLTMITDAMFFKSEDDTTGQQSSVKIGALTFSLTTLYISAVGLLITAVPVVLVTMIFTNSKKPKQRNEKTQNSSKKYHKPTIEFSDDTFYTSDKLPLPSFFWYIAWIVVCLAVLSSSFFLLLYSMEWGKSKTEEWLTSFLLSFVESILVVDPLKVIVVAAALSMIFKRPSDTKCAEINIEELKKASRKCNGGSIRSLLSFRNEVLSSNEPLTGDKLVKIRQQVLRKQKELEVFLQLLFYIIFAFIMYSISYVNRDERSYDLKNHLYRSLYDSNGQFGYGQVNDAAGFINWLNGTFFERYFPLKDYSGADLGVRDTFFFSDLDNAKIGPPRLRQVRMKRGTCPYKRLIKNRDCIPGYDMSEEDEQSYCVGWNDASSPTCNSPNLYSMDAWRYQRSEDIWGIPITGEYETYGGGGYILKLDNGLENSRYIAQELMRYNWINRETRGVFLEFTLYNANTNLIIYLIFLAEFTENGGLFTWVDIYPFRIYQLTGALGVYAMVCYMIYLAVLLYGTVTIVMKIIKLKRRCFFHMWNVVDFCCVLLSYAAVVLWCLRYRTASEALDRYYNDKDAFINFQHVVILDMSFNVIAGILVFVATIRLLKIMEYNRRMTQLASVITNAAVELASFAVIFGIGFSAWVVLGYFLFGTNLSEYRSVFKSAGSLSNSLIGKNKLATMTSAVSSAGSSIFINTYYFTYVLFIMFILMTMFSAILNSTITMVKNDADKVANSYGILGVLNKHIGGLVRLMFNVKPKRNSSRDPRKNITPGHPSLQPKLDTANIFMVLREIFGDTGVDKDMDEPKQLQDDALLDIESFQDERNPYLISDQFVRYDTGYPETASMELNPENIRLDVISPFTLKEKIYTSFV